ncbi:Partner of Y14 and mago [Zancudomyces culisetae]|uniref:Partner of Y14 and mago n=1 Tax=Zancudomyces culisetae TaxID=1213189 RepID=A0A1R1PY70_ZANCU|nr:Partner of Y14 and mago [Zancudomyces culisetae]OMH85868.1 Partner of Y14 and mago [Zancudomyces culisetae]|eukprot:OMH80683.1 Partner of Y14 and mago [Zancudomyces culisetae]
MSNELLDKTPVTKSAVSYIPASVRADGSVRKERRVREGYAPRESIPRYVIPMLRSSSQSPELSNREIKKKGNDTNTGIGRGIYRNVDSKTPEFSKEDFPPL